MFVSLLLALFAVQGHRLTSADAGTITRAVADYMIPGDRSIGTHSVVGRTVIFDQAHSVLAWEPLVGKVNVNDITTTLPSLIMSEDQAVHCAKPKYDCTVSRDAIYLGINSVERGPREGQYRIRATIRFAEKNRQGVSHLEGGTYTLIVGLVGTKYKHWEVQSTSPKITW
ncbi:MAG TPA: hypothetical protein VFT41_06605 [Gemmatimonadaceae bacterium]|nr:hypothetical protein [Gemmatimonadaceae bacterium]